MTGFSQLEVYNTQRAKVYENGIGPLAQAPFVIDLTHLPEGIYYFILICDTIPFIKQ